MFERYTEKARRVIFFARYEASELGSPCIEVAHLLLGLIREDRRLFERLISGKATLEDLVEEIRAGLTQNVKISTSVDLPLSHSAKRVLAYCAEEAEELGDKIIGTPHLLLGVLREETPAAATLEKFGINLHRLRAEERTSGTADKQSRAAMETLRGNFAPLLERLAPEVEPATTFSLHRFSRDEPQ